MELKNVKISTQLTIGFGFVLCLVLVLGLVSYLQTAKIHDQIEIMYQHPLIVRRAIGNLKADILLINLQWHNLTPARSAAEVQYLLEQEAMFHANAEQQVVQIYESYLGPRSNVDSIAYALGQLKTMGSEIKQSLLDGKIREIDDQLSQSGSVGIKIKDALDAINVVDNFAINKGDELYARSKKLYRDLLVQLVLLIACILILSLAVVFFALRNIRRPVAELARAATEFKNGNYHSRCNYELKNEFGSLSNTFNRLVESVQYNAELNQKTSQLAGMMLSEYDAKRFFKDTLYMLANHTDSQIAAIYLLSDDKQTYEHFESIGMDLTAKRSFLANTHEGEFGSVLASAKVQHIKNIPQDTQFVFKAVAGNFLPCEIMTIPVLAGNQIVAILSLASLHCYSQQSIHLIDNIFVTLSARVEGILAYHKLKEFTQQLEMQNNELQSQKSELTAQANELAEQNRELEAQKQKLDEAGRLKTTFLSNMSHELRTPLNSVIALSGVLNRRLAGKLPAEEYGYIDIIERNGKLLLDLINDVLDIARIESGKDEINVEIFSMSDLVNELVELMTPQAQQKNIELLVRAHTPDVMIESDSNKCRHILQNIIGNAVKFTEKGGVTICIDQAENKVFVSVTDTGIGILEENFSMIFDEFRQADGSTSRKYGGTGLGLAIAKKYARLLGGSIILKSTIGKGSIFTLTLPGRVSELESKTQVMAIRHLKPIAHGPKANARILLVEDSEPAIIQIRDVLSDSGYQLSVARGGKEALACIESELPDAIILDLMIPGVDGFEVLKTIREVERTAHVPVLILTAKHLTRDDLKFLTRNHIHQLIQKGDVNRTELLNAIASMVHEEVDIATKEQQLPKAKRVKKEMTGKPLILVVEDNPDNMVTMKALLSESYTVLEALDGTSGIYMANTYQPHLILMDIGLPSKDGIEAFTVIRNSPDTAAIPIFAVTASSMVIDKDVILKQGFDAYIPKPIDASLLLASIQEVLYAQ